MTQTAESMTPRERWVAALELKPVDRLPFWPKLGGNYAPARRGTCAGMPNDEIHDFIGSDRHVNVPPPFSVRRPDSSITTEKESELITRRIYRIGNRKMVERIQNDPASGAPHPIEMPIKTREDIAAMAAFYRNAVVTPNKENIRKAEETQQQFKWQCQFQDRHRGVPLDDVYRASRGHRKCALFPDGPSG